MFTTENNKWSLPPSQFLCAELCSWEVIVSRRGREEMLSSLLLYLENCLGWLGGPHEQHLQDCGWARATQDLSSSPDNSSAHSSGIHCMNQRDLEDQPKIQRKEFYACKTNMQNKHCEWDGVALAKFNSC